MALIPYLKFCLPCPPQSGEEHFHQDYHPLTKEEIAQLLRNAKAAERLLRDTSLVATLSSIQRRLRQGIEGITCPVEISGIPPQRLRAIDLLFMRNIGRCNSRLVDRFYNLMRWKKWSERLLIKDKKFIKQKTRQRVLASQK